MISIDCSMGSMDKTGLQGFWSVRLTPNHQPETRMKSRVCALFSHRSNGEKRGVWGRMGRIMHHERDSETPDPAESRASTGAADKKKPNR
jgi:hypothetical protein